MPWPSDVQILGLIIAMNIVLSGLHFVLFQIHEKKKWVWSQNVLNVVSFLMTAISLMGCNIRHPDNKPEVQK